MLLNRYVAPELQETSMVNGLECELIGLSPLAACNYQVAYFCRPYTKYKYYAENRIDWSWHKSTKYTIAEVYEENCISNDSCSVELWQKGSTI
jgi:hypothetical protein